MNRIGVDITSVDRLKRAVERRPRLLGRLFTADELADAGKGRQRWPRIAARFAAKEALIKAAGGMRGSRYHDIIVRRRPGLPPEVSVSGPLGEWLRRHQYEVAVSLSHEHSYAVAMVTLLCVGA
ncbi:MAG: holo-[acyl-carrier-protein] synthase [Sulfobacillus acidophilus]|uniref:Holo-[acyl-carrier-protein] synthase n=1 Tax=Sulfobacillus acidophilus TaxID=53633 RepID=A0A2T2WMQ9_9FIRM|nr:MAG: holo-[acyl-carrier-protein] synthase [Sulfobacillus acidophilus]